uniref:NADP-dependent oxidoreductase domain-containing protein n=1 Tax=Chelonoidis abingdonii TaxID=106734 RepID=A0A8C0JD72_CHEAB
MLDFFKLRQAVMRLLLSLQSPPGAVQEAVEVALDAGYQHVDCAYFYQNEAEIGAAFQKKFGEGRLKRDELYVVSKVSPIFLPNRSPGLPILSKLPQDLGYWPCLLISEFFPTPCSKQDQSPTKSSSTSLFSWQTMEKLVDEGLVKSVGVSNFNVSQLERLLSVCRIKPAANQVELHPYLTQPQLVEYCKSKGIVLIAYSPFGCPALPCPSGENSPVPLLENPTVNEIAQKHGKTSAQVLIRFHIQRGIATIPKSITPARIVENAEVTGMASKPGALFRSWRMAEVLLSPEQGETLHTSDGWGLVPKPSCTQQDLNG